MPALHDVTVRTEGLSLKTALRLRDEGAEICRSAEADDTGRVTVRVPGPEVRYVVRPVDAMEVTVTDPGGYLARQGFRTGDLIIGTNGREFENLEQIRIAFGETGTIRFIVLRSGARLEIAMSLAPLRAGEVEPGGTVEPTIR